MSPSRLRRNRRPARSGITSGLPPKPKNPAYRPKRPDSPGQGSFFQLVLPGFPGREVAGSQIIQPASFLPRRIPAEIESFSVSRPADDRGLRTDEFRSAHDPLNGQAAVFCPAAGGGKRTAAGQQRGESGKQDV